MGRVFSAALVSLDAFGTCSGEAVRLLRVSLKSSGRSLSYGLDHLAVLALGNPLELLVPSARYAKCIGNRDLEPVDAFADRLATVE
jgi:hypothetical protein